MQNDAIVIGAGIGGLTCAAALVKKGLKVLVLEKESHPGGTSYIFQRGAYKFPMGPLAFSYPAYVKNLLISLGLKEPLRYKRNHFQLITPHINIIYSCPFEELQIKLAKLFPQEARGLETFFNEMEEAIKLVRDLYLWHPDYWPEKLKEWAKKQNRERDINKIAVFCQTPSFKFLQRHFKNKILINFLGSMGSAEPTMSLLTLALMWNIMSSEGIWYPSWGIHEISNRLVKVIEEKGAKYHAALPIRKIFIENNRASGIITADGSLIKANWLISNVDYKTTFLDLVEQKSLKSNFLNQIKTIPYTGSEFCIYLGIDPKKCDLSQMKATHLFYSPGSDLKNDKDKEILNLENREIEICRWTDNEPHHAPPDRVGLVIRTSFDYDFFAHFRTGEKKRTPEYVAYKNDLALKIIKLVERIIPGLEEATELMEVATPLTYQDWGNRYKGSIAGWDWRLESTKAFGRKLLVETPIRNLLMVGIYAAAELFMGGVPTAMRTAELASEIIADSFKL